MKTISTAQVFDHDDQVAAQELELRGLLARVMAAPLDPMLQRMDSIDARMDELEEICRESRDLAHGACLDSAEQKKASERSLRGLQKASEEVRSSMLDGFSAVGNNLSSGISSISATSDGIHSGVGQLRVAISSIDEELKRTSGNVDAVVPVLQGGTQQLKDELLQSLSQHGERLSLMQQTFQRKFTVLALACAFSVLSNIVLLVSILR